MPSDNSLRTELGRRIRAIRTSRGITGQKLAEMAKISPAHLSEVERGNSEMSGEKLLRIATSLDVSVQALLEGTPEPPVAGGEVIPSALAEAAEQLKLTFKDTISLLQGKRSLTAQRSSDTTNEWKAQDWIDFYNKVRKYLDD